MEPYHLRARHTKKPIFQRFVPRKLAKADEERKQAGQQDS